MRIYVDDSSKYYLYVADLSKFEVNDEFIVPEVDMAYWIKFRLM